ncbi:catalase [candidate division KSB1 bacterium]
MSEKKRITTASGRPVEDNQNSMTAGPRGPLLMQDVYLQEKLAHFDREEIPERIVHAKGAGAHGVFTVTNDITKYTKAKIFSKIGKKTETFTRFSTVGGERGSADTARDPRGFATKFYTEEGNWDLVGNNTPVFFIRDPLKFPDFIHTQKRLPDSNLKSAEMVWDFWSKTPEALHQVTILFSNRGTPDGYRFMNGYSSHTYSLINAQDERFWVKFHLKSMQGIKNLSDAEAVRLAGENPDYATEDLFNAIKNGDNPKWNMKIQVMPEMEAETYAINPFDLTKVWPHNDYPLIEVGILELNRNPVNYFNEVEQSAFSPSNIVPGIGFSPCKMLQGRLFSYPDTQRYRLGVNYNFLPINRPRGIEINNNFRNGFMRFDDNGGDSRNYEPSNFDVPTESPEFREPPLRISGDADRYDYDTDINSDTRQAGDLYRLMPPEEKKDLVNNIIGAMTGVPKNIQILQLGHFYMADAEYGSQIAEGLGISVDEIKG